MLRGPLYREDYHPRLSGHETFPVRYGWLKKAYDAVRDTEESQDDNRHVFAGPDAIARFGVGKNMVASMRHWATVTGIIDDNPDHRRIFTTPLGRQVFSDGGLDPYMENPATAWLLHLESVRARHQDKRGSGLSITTLPYPSNATLWFTGSKSLRRSGVGVVPPRPPSDETFPVSYAPM